MAHSTKLSISPSDTKITTKKKRDSFAFGTKYVEDDDYDYGEGGTGGARKLDDDAPCPERDSDSELERARASQLPTRCKTYDNQDEEDDETSNFREAPDFEYISTYEEYLDHYVTWKDLYYFESEDTARLIMTLGYRVPELLSKAQFEEVMEGIRAKRFEKRRDDIHIAWEIQSQIKCPLMQALADREVPNRNGNLACIIYIRTVNLRNEEVSAWIDFRLARSVRLKSDDQLWYDYFSGKRKLIPRSSDLCFYNWSTFQVRFNSSDNYLITTDINEGLQFMNKADRKLITLNPKKYPGDNTEVIHVRAPNYMHCMIYDHSLRIKA